MSWVGLFCFYALFVAEYPLVFTAGVYGMHPSLFRCVDLGSWS